MLINFDHLKTFSKALNIKMKGFRGNWNQNDPTADDYIKNRPFYSEGLKETTITLVNNLSSDDDRDAWPECNFTPGKLYNVTWNNVLYENVRCVFDGGYNVLGEPDKYPFYIDDDGGNSLYIGSDDDYWTLTITIIEKKEVVHKLDKKFIDMPDGIVTEDDLDTVAFTGNYYDLWNQPTIYTDVVRYSTTQSLTDTQKTQARTNIDVYSKNEVYKDYMQLSTYVYKMPSARQWHSVTYGNGKFVAVAIGSEYAAYSEDGINWIETTMPISHNWYSVTYGNGKFVAVILNSDIAAYSKDGINWIETTMPISDRWHSVTYGNGKFVAIADSNSISAPAAYSEDGINWTLTKMPASREWNSIAYGNGKFVAVAKNSKQAAYSEDGINWIFTTMPTYGVNYYNWSSVTYGNGKFVAVTTVSDRAAYSEDGINWVETSTNSSSTNCYSVTYGNGKFVTVANNSDIAAYSEDGINWVETTMPISDDWYSVTYGNGKFVAAIRNSDIAAYSKDGINWTNTYTYPSQNGVKITLEQLGIVDSNVPQPDWSQNDETAADYIKNKPFYTGDTVEEVLLAETTVEIGSDLYVTLPSAVVLEEGKTYIVTLNETQYKCTAGVLSNGTTMVGNDSFKFGTNRDNTQSMLQVTTEGSYTISVTQCVTPVFKLDAKYLPDHLPSENPVEILPETTFTMDFNYGLFDLNGMFTGAYNKGDVCTVIFDGIEYECTAYIEDSEMKYTALGGLDQSYPFEVYSHYVQVQDEQQHTIRIINRNVKKLDNKFLDINTTDNIMDAEDDDVPTVKAVMDELNGFAGWVDSELSKIPALPEITSADNGKVLMVVNGKLQLVSLNLSVDANGVITVQ